MIDRELTDKLVQGLKMKYETEPQNVTTEERFILMVAAIAQYLDDWDRYSDFLASFNQDMTARLSEMDATISRCEAGKLPVADMWEKWSVLFPDDVEDKVQGLGNAGCDILAGIYRLRQRLVQADEKMRPVVPENAWPFPQWRLDEEKKQLLFLMEEGSEFEKEARRRAMLKMLYGADEFAQIDSKYIKKYGHGVGTDLAIE